MDEIMDRHIQQAKCLKAQIDYRRFQINRLEEDLRQLLDQQAELELFVLNPELALLRERKSVLERRARIAEAYVSRLASEYLGTRQPQVEEMFLIWSGEVDPAALLDKTRQELHEVLEQIDAFEKST